VQQLQPGNAAAFASGGLASQCLGDEAAADAQFTRSLQLDPNQPALRAAMQ
jgi:Flp pilus assembly protein TadD